MAKKQSITVDDQIKSLTKSVSNLAALVSSSIAPQLQDDNGIDNDDPIMAACDDAEVALLKDIQDNGVKVCVSRDRRGNINKTNMHGVQYDMIQRIKLNRKKGNNRVF
tara:strand:+ start:157 stop:480 length:324 start_codon:yes stop_codon:yes gene_type:complete